MLHDSQHTTRNRILRIAFLAFACFIIFFLITFLFLRSVSDGSRHVDFAVKSGWGLQKVSEKLHEQGLIHNPFFFNIYARLTSQGAHIKRGVFSLDDGMSARQIMAIITSGKTKTITVTIPEGYHNRQIGDLFVEKKFFISRDEFLAFASRKNILDRFKIPANSSEGYLFPDTYYLPPAYPKEKIIVLMIEHFFEKAKEVKNFPTDPKRIHEAIILSSIVEREAQRKEERALIAAVFHNRLRDAEPLESCATVQYLFEKPKARLFFRDLEVSSPYNTYRVKGLPPGPIASPGLAAIDAAVNPEKTDYKFFVLKGDGAHQFSKSYGDHLAAKKKYIGP